MKLTYRYRVKNLHGELNRQARAVNYVWNFCNESQRSCLRLGKRWLSAFDLSKLTTGTSTELGVRADTITAIGRQYVASRTQRKRPYLNWRGRRSLGWVPVCGRDIKRVDGGFKFYGRVYRIFYSRPLPALAIIKNGSSFSQDSKGNWYLNLVLSVADVPARKVENAVGVDLGLKDLATLSTGERIENPRHLAGMADKIGRAQRANKKRLARNLSARLQNRRRDFHHKRSTELVKRFDFIAVGNVDAARLKKTKMAKSVSDAGWSSFRSMLAYKAIKHGAVFEEVNENYSSQTCSHCGCLPDGRPEGIAGLGIRTWQCSECGTTLDRDVNAARNILFGSGYRALAEGARLVLAGNINDKTRGFIDAAIRSGKRGGKP